MMDHVFDGPLTSVALCWTMERPDGAGIALTSHDSAIDREGVAFCAAPGMTPAAFGRGLGLDPDSGEVQGVVTSTGIAEADLALGRWDHAAIQLSAHDWSDDNRTPLDLLAGQLGEVSIGSEGFSAELNGAAARLQRPVCPATSPHCRAELGDKRCRVDLAGRSLVARVVSQEGDELALEDAVEERFLLGRLRYLRGANCGIQTVILAVSENRLRLRDLPRGPVAPGCLVELREGCDKRFTTCVDRFANAANFRGEPHLPGNDLLTRYPGA